MHRAHGIDKLRKRYLIAAAAHNLGCLMRSLFQMGTPRGLQKFVDLLSSLYLAIHTRCHQSRARHGASRSSDATIYALHTCAA